MSTSKLYYHYRVMGMVSNDVKAVIETRGSETFVTTCVGKAYQTYNVNINIKLTF